MQRNRHTIAAGICLKFVDKYVTTPREQAHTPDLLAKGGAKELR
jgi:hypothetical protein